MIKKRGVLRFGVLCLLITLACACECDERDLQLQTAILKFKGSLDKSIDALMICFNDMCGNPDYKKMVCDFIIEKTKTVERCDDDKFVSKEAATMCKDCWSERENPLPNPLPNPPPRTPPNPPPRTPPNPPPRTPPQTPLKNTKIPEPQISSWNISDILWDAVFDNFVAHAISSVFTWIEDCLMWAWDLLLKYVLPVALSTLSIALWIASRFFPPLQLISDKLPIIVMIGWFTFALYYLWLFGSYECFNDRIFIIFWVMSYTNVEQASNGNRTQIDNKTQNIFNGPTLILQDQTGSVLHQILPQFFGGRAQPEPLIAGQSPTMQLPPSQDSEASYVTPIDNPSVPAARSRSSHSSSSSHHKVPAPPAARGNTKPATEASVKKECVNPAPRAAAATAASPVNVSQHPPAGEPSMTPRKVFNTVCDFVQRVCVKSEQYVKPEQTLKRPRNANEHTEDQLSNKKQKLTVPQLKEKLDKAGVPYLKNARKADLLESAEKADLL